MQFEKRITECGAPLYVFEMPYAPSVSCGVLVKVGTVDEEWPKEAGLAHAFEHMVFQGNKKFKNSKAVGAFIEEIGGSSNAWTRKEMTFFHLVVPKSEFTRGFAWLYHLLGTPSLTEKHIQTEMRNVIQEIKRRNDNPAGLSQSIFEEIAYGRHPLSRDTLGTTDAVSVFTREDFERYHTNFYHTENFVFIAAGNVTTERALDAVNAHVWRTDPRYSLRVRKSPPLRYKKRVRILEKDGIEQAHAITGIPIGPAKSGATKALGLFEVMIDGGSSFPLFQEVRDKRGLCYSVHAILTPWTEHGLFFIYVGTNPGKYEEALEIIKKIVSENAGNEELFNKAKKLLAGKAMLTHEASPSILRSAAMSIIFKGEPKSPEELLQEIERITLEDVQTACATYLDVEKFSEACIIPRLPPRRLGYKI